MTSNNLCSSCTNIGCEFQSGIVRTKCAFYVPPHIESDNCGNYVVMQSTYGNGELSNGGWIPVSERLPKDRREVLVTVYWHETYQVMIASYFGDGLWWCVPFNNCGEHMQRLKPKAWMPLPTPYEPRESEVNNG